MDKFPLARPGWPYVLGALLLALVATALGVWWLAVPLWLAALIIINFFRDPARAAQAGSRAVISPADGKVVAVQDAVHQDLPGGRGRMISIFMNIFDVHVNRAPVSGRVQGVRRVPGGFLPADRPQAAVANERVEVVIAPAGGGALVVSQVAGLVARRIHCRLAPGDIVQRGQRYGMIRFGSRLDVYLPLEAEARVQPGQRVRAGVTVIGELPDGPPQAPPQP
ncbi:MAG: phosphatidylserine decarboxylase family protein [Desulfarculus sp.]|nr:MAG: phosphatidylserine decarboxylase family protein [Desulfarculus sp.]